MRQNTQNMRSLRSKNTKPKLEQTHTRKQSFTLHTTPSKQKHLHQNEKEMALHGDPTMTQLILKINPEYDKILPHMTNEEYEALKQSIKEEGQHFPIIINADHEILDGHHRNRACLDLELEPDFEVKHFEDKLSERMFVIEANLRRRQLNPLDAVKLGVEIEKIEAERAKQRQFNANPNGVNQYTEDLVSNEPKTSEKGKAMDLAAKKVNLSPTTYYRAKTVLEKGTPELQEKVRKGKTSIAHAYNVITTQENHKNPKPIPQETFNVIYADPPWQYDLQKRGSTLGHYESLSVDEICLKFKPKSAEDSILFLWATNPKLPEALQVMQSWGFTYKTNLVWVKDKIGTGYYLRGQHELLLVGVKGAIGVPEEHTRPPSVLNSPRKDHSQKPPEVYELIETMYPNRKYLELFARNSREGWESWGNEV